MFQHTKRTFHGYTGKVVDELSGFWVVDLDMNSPHTVDRFVPRMRNARLTTKDCQDYLYCGLPYLVPVLNMIWKTHWIPGPAPNIPTPVSMNVLSKLMIPHGKRYTIRVEGKTIYSYFFIFSDVQDVLQHCI